MAALTLSGRQLIGGELCAEGNVVFRAIDPQSGEHLAPPFHQASNAEVAQAAELAEAAFDPFRNISIDQRADFLDAIGEELTAIGPQLIARAGEETALPEMRLQGELVRTVNQLKLFARVLRDGSYQDARIDCAQPQRQPLPKADVRSMLIPLGPVAIFGASNFPLAFSVAGGDTAAALAAGCPVVFKGHPLHPGTCELAAQSISSAAVRNGLPPGVFALLQSDSNHTGAALVQQPQIKALAFTGSLAGGRALFDLACARSEPIPVFAEMGSINPLVCLPQAVAERTESLAQGLADSITLGVGQFCTAPGLLLLIDDASSQAFIQKLTAALVDKAFGVMLHPGIKQNYLAALKAVSAVDEVALLLEGAESQQDCCVAPSLLKASAQTLLENPLVTAEMFGPTAVVVLCKDAAELCAVAESLQGQLTATLHASEDELAAYGGLLTILQRKAGRIVFNGFPTGVEVCDAMVHGGPYPASSDSRTTSVGTAAITRFLRPVCYQNSPQSLLPVALQDANASKLWRTVDGRLSQDDL